MGVMMTKEMTFTDWLSEELKERRWQQKDLAEAAGVSDSTITLVLKGERRPGPDLCNGIARAFRLPPEMIFRKAGILPALPEEDDELARMLVEGFKRLSIEKRREVLSYVVWKIQESRSEDTKGLDGNGTGHNA
jgi:transcriptional regulator with XRE-family HTH domain